MTGILLSALYIFLFLLLIGRLSFFTLNSIPRSWIMTAFLLKVLAGTGLWAVYTYLYSDRSTADIFKYFDDGMVLYNRLFVQPSDYFKVLLGMDDTGLETLLGVDIHHWYREFNQGMYNENRTLIRFNALVALFSFGHYHVHTVFICFLSTLGLMGIFKSFASILQGKEKIFFALLFLLPSLLFWGSGVLKESLVLFALGMSVFHFFRLLTGEKILKQALLLTLFLALLALTKLYILLVLMPSLLAYAWLSKTNFRYPEWKFLGVLAFCFLGALLLPGYDIPFMLMEKQRQAVYMAEGGSYLVNYESKKFIYISAKTQHRIDRIPADTGYCKIVAGVPYVSWNLETFMDSTYIPHSADTNTYWIFYDQETAGSFIQIPRLNGKALSLFNNAPAAFANTFFRPYPFEARSPLMLLAAAENALLVVIGLTCLFLCYRNIPDRQALWFCVTVVILLFVLIGLTTPVTGAAVRYRVPALPFLITSFLLILDQGKLSQRLPFLKKILAP